MCIPLTQIKKAIVNIQVTAMFMGRYITLKITASIIKKTDQEGDLKNLTTGDGLTLAHEKTIKEARPHNPSIVHKANRIQHPTEKMTDQPIIFKMESFEAKR